MLEVTPLAAEKLTGLRAADPAHRYVRVYVAGGGCCGVRFALAFDEAARPDDTVLERGGIPLAIDPVSLPHVEGATIDYVNEPAGEGFVVDSPSAGGGGCACGR
ncbi:MAG TPA: iron-sulfur cluster assembly accessory protein [Candidatus Limnocylindrales bacterium]|nr:iron-sulfur cluster assembly accessory protein [Candidatus Limnocylindrales bacterium]